MTTYIVEIDREIITEAARMVGYWNAGEVLCTISMGEGFTLAALFNALHEHEIAAHIIREVWEGDERFRFEPRHAFEDEPDVIEHYEREDARKAATARRIRNGR